MNNKKTKLNHILVVEELGIQRVFTLESEVYSVGRHSSSDIKLNSSPVSRHHGTLIRDDLGNNEYAYTLIDGDFKGHRSQNGILVNGKKIIRRRLQHGDQILFGGEEIKGVYYLESQEEVNRNTGPNDNWRVERNRTNTAREELQNTLILSEQNLSGNLQSDEIKRLASFPELSPHPIIEIDFQGKITYMNPSARLSFPDLSDDNQNNSNHPLMVDVEIPKDRTNSQLEQREVHAHDRHFEQYIHYLSKYNVIRSYIFDITERKISEEKLQYQAFHDSLTGIGNRDYFHRQLNNRLREVEEKNEHLAILFIDIDRFKNINDTLNHSTGDKLLESFSYRILSCLSTDCIFSRWGGDEFILGVPLGNDQNHTNTIDDTTQVIMDSLKNPFLIDNYTIYVTCSVGVAIYPRDGNTQEQLIKNADIALSRAKQMGKNNSQYYTTQLSEEQMLLFELETSLYDAIAHNQLYLNYQPQLNLDTNKIESAEALVRWKHPTLGVISPGKFIPLAEETGLIISIGEWVLKTACIQAKKWIESGYGLKTIAVNISVKQFRQENFVEIVKNILESVNLEPKYLELEVTESILMQDRGKTALIINELSELGVKFSLDDFGTGYSSLSYLKKFPFHTIKIDQSFIRDLTVNQQDRALIDAVITLGKGYNMQVVAEGVETEAQLRLLEKFNCDIIQGRWLSMPISDVEFTQFIINFALDNHAQKLG
ncbi:EAL domain-containing protein [Cyanobacterium stanieri LEGE 03274]|uniref:EAL domain-containing protein n=1 Tax=Cyanobacterium stanieri LEGE 03274 TaxID=1828756 RepID=A0ABR9V8V3_9CHRO|nr:EAL domain-containing protein [Cyanobacterium stanieri]MBE9223279.1 EAL domain-containing protein [Cyanobacterium stanieri LEGE 03274]